MTSTTLSRTQSARLDATGSGVITLRPDVGQNWAPLFVRVSTASNKAPVAYCAVYHGSPGVTPQASQFIDDTFLGNGDSSSMIAGTPILYGEGIIFSFQGGNPGDTAIATVYGMQSDLPPNLDLVPQVPGTHFAGHLSTEIVRDVDTKLTGVFVNAGAFFTSAIFDMRLFGSFYLQLYSLTSSNPATAYNPQQLLMNWYTDSSQQTLMYQDTYEWFADNQTGALINTMGDVMIQDAIHGPYLVIQIFNNTLSADQVNTSYVLKGTTRTGLPLYVRQQNAQSFFGNGVDGVLIDHQGNLVAGAATLPMALGYGAVGVELVNNDANAMNFWIGFGSEAHGTNPQNTDFIAQLPAFSAIGRNPPVMYSFPKRAGVINITGTGTGSYAVRAISTFNKT